MPPGRKRPIEPCCCRSSTNDSVVTDSQSRKLNAALVDSLKRYGQMAPVVVCVCDGEFLLIDGFKRLAAARSIKGFDTLRARSIECDERSAKAALYNLNRVGRGVQEIEEAWIVQALIREDGLSQVEVAELLSHHKSWVCRRLALSDISAPARPTSAFINPSCFRNMTMKMKDPRKMKKSVQMKDSRQSRDHGRLCSGRNFRSQ